MIIKDSRTKGKSIAIPDNEIDKLVEKLECSIVEAIDVYLSDNDIINNKEQQNLNEKAAAVKTSNIVKAKATTPPKKTQKERATKPDEKKEFIISTVAAALEKISDCEVTITDKRKVITFNYQGELFKLDLTRTRAKK